MSDKSIHNSNRIIGTEFSQNIDFAALAHSMGAVGFTVKRCEQLKSIVDPALSCKKPCVIDLHIDVNAEYPPITGIWYEPTKTKDESMPRGSKREWT